jgi:hypothetical protein
VTAPRLPTLGSVVRASIEDANGFRKLRPAVVVTATADIALGKKVRVVAVTTRVSDPLPSDHVLLPWDPKGVSRSGLRRRCAAVVTWLSEVAVEDLQVVGILPPAVISDVLRRLSATMPDRGPPAAEF